MPLFLVLLLMPVLAAASTPPVTVLTIDAPITPATADYFTQGLKRSVENGSSLVVLKIDTPGGLDTSMREIIKAILASPDPGRDFRVSERRAGGERRHLHPVCEPHRRDGARHEPGRRDAGANRNWRAEQRANPPPAGAPKEGEPARRKAAAKRAAR